MKKNLKPLIDEGYNYFAIEEPSGTVMGTFKTFDDAMIFYKKTPYNIYMADRLVKLYPDLFEIRVEPVSGLDLTQILKDCPKGTPLYSPLFGDVKFYEVKDDGVHEYPIKVNVTNTVLAEQQIKCFKCDGKYLIGYANDECMLFPSKDCRDWSQFVPPVPEHKPEPKHDFKPFDKVLVRDPVDGFWEIDLYGYRDINSGYHQCLAHLARVCIPYEGNEHLLGTTDEPTK